MRGLIRQAQEATPEAFDEGKSHMETAMKYRKKPVVIEAMRVGPTAESWEAAMKFVGGASGAFNGHLPDDDPNKAWFCIDTLEGQMFAKNGDWIIKGVKGEFYPCKPDIFEATYEPEGAAAAKPSGEESKDE